MHFPTLPAGQHWDNCAGDLCSKTGEGKEEGEIGGGWSWWGSAQYFDIPKSFDADNSLSGL